MDIKGQYDCERTFIVMMWMSALFSLGLGVYTDNVQPMVYSFAGSLALALAVCLPEWPMFNRNPLFFRSR